MQSNPNLQNETARLEELRSLGILDTPPEKAFQFFTAMAAMVCQAPVAAIGLMDEKRQWFKAEVGIGQTQLPKQDSICTQTMLENKLLVISDLKKDKRFKDLKLDWKFYAGLPLTSSKGHVLGTLFIADKIKRNLTDEQKETLSSLAQQIVYMIEYQAERQKLA